VRWQVNIPGEVVVKDMNGDGAVDVVVAVGDSTFDGVKAYLNANDGSSLAWESVDVATGLGGVVAVAAADMDGDGDLDLVTVTDGDESVYWHRNDGGAATVWATRVVAEGVSGASFTDVVAADFEGDGDVDVVRRRGRRRKEKSGAESGERKVESGSLFLAATAKHAQRPVTPRTPPSLSSSFSSSSSSSASSVGSPVGRWRRACRGRSTGSRTTAFKTSAAR
jgi:hypothetical protein